MHLAWLAAPLRLATRTFRSRGHINAPFVLVLSAFGIAQIAIVTLCSYIDGTWYLPGSARGLLQHYGAWAILVSDPLLLVAAGYAYYRLRLTFSTLPISESGKAREEVRRLLLPYFSWIKGGRNGTLVYALLVVLGLFCWLTNIHQTIAPELVYHHDVFDSRAHIYGFLAYKFCLFTSWVIVYPVVGYLLLSMSISTRIALERLRRRQLLRPHVTHPDNCYGLRNVGTLNVALLWPYFVVYVVMFLLLITHQSIYETLLFPLIAITVIFVAMSYVVIGPAYKLLNSAKRETYAELVRRSSARRDQHGPNTLKFAVERLCYVAADASPYSSNAKRLLVAMRLIPIGALVLKLVVQYSALVR